MEVFNRTGALERLGGDVERLEDLLEDFQMKLPALMKALARSAEHKRPERLTKLAEALRSSSRAVGAEGMEGLASQILEATEASEFDQVETLITHMSMELEWLTRVLDENRCSGNL